MTTPLSCAAIAKQYGRSAVSVRRWILTGCGPHRLRAVRVGGRWMIDPADMTAFIEACTEAALPEETKTSPTYVSEKRQQKRLEAAREKLRAQGMRV